jgi:hypothetical protein
VIYAVEIGSGGMIYIPGFMTGSGIEVILKFCLNNLREAVMLVLLTEGIYEVRR